MEMLRQFLDFFLKLDEHLRETIDQYGPWTYVILLLIIFCETGLVVTPFLPGDSLLFAAGAFAAMGSLDLVLLIVLLSIAAVLGDCVNYFCGHFIGPKVFRYEGGWFFRREHLDRTRRVFEKYGAKTIVIARFIPIVRTFAPFLAGVGEMSYRRFLMYNVLGAVLWVAGCVIAGYLFGNIPVVKENFTLVILGIIFVSILPAIIEVIRERSKSKEDAPIEDNRPLEQIVSK